MTIRVLVADDQKLVRTGLRMVLKPEPDAPLRSDARQALERFHEEFDAKSPKAVASSTATGRI